MGDGRVGENEPDKMADSPLIPIQDANSPPLKKKQKCNRVKTGERVKTKKAGTTLSLPNIIDHQRFQRSAVSLGHCSLCGEGAAMYHSKEQRASICEKCYARLVREWNRGEGVV